MVRRESPIHNLPVEQVSLVVAVGEGESSEFLRQSREFASACIDKGISTDLMVIRGHHHISIMGELGSENGTITSAILEQIATG